jgi:hypothetical protein
MGLTLKEIIEIEPRLEELRGEAMAIMANSPGPYWKRNKAWYHELKPRFKYLVGFMAAKPELRSCETYDLVYAEFVRILKV